MRYIWKGTISFGLVNIPVGLLSAAKDREVKFSLLHKKDLSEVRYARICKVEDIEIPYEEIVKGVKHGGKYKIFTPEEIKDIHDEKSNHIEISTFCAADEVDPIYFEKPFFLKAEKGGEKAYLLLKNALVQTDKVAIAHYVLKNHYHIAVIKPYKNILVLNRLRFHSQIIDIKQASPESMRLPTKETDLAVKLIDQLSGHFKPEDYKDKYVETLEKALKKKVGKGQVSPPSAQIGEVAKVYDIMELLKASLEEPKPAIKKRKTK
jgi:DNA end-binding protein Ku